MKFKITSSYYNEHTKELQLYVGEAIHTSISYDNEPNEDEIEEMIEEVENQYEDNEFMKKINNGLGFR